VQDALIELWTPPEDVRRALTPMERLALEYLDGKVSESTLAAVAAADAMPTIPGEFQQIGKALDLLTELQVNDQEFLARAGLLESRNRFVEALRGQSADS
jgi:hypothetical protein